MMTAWTQAAASRFKVSERNKRTQKKIHDYSIDHKLLSRILCCGYTVCISIGYRIGTENSRESCWMRLMSWMSTDRQKKIT